MEDVLDKVNRYSSLSAPVVISAGGRPTFFTAILHGAGGFFSHLLFTARFSRRQPWLHAGGQQRGRLVLPLRKSNADSAAEARLMQC